MPALPITADQVEYEIELPVLSAAEGPGAFTSCAIRSGSSMAFAMRFSCTQAAKVSWDIEHLRTCGSLRSWRVPPVAV